MMKKRIKYDFSILTVAAAVIAVSGIPVQAMEKNSPEARPATTELLPATGGSVAEAVDKSHNRFNNGRLLQSGTVRTAGDLSSRSPLQSGTVRTAGNLSSRSPLQSGMVRVAGNLSSRSPLQSGTVRTADDLAAANR